MAALVQSYPASTSTITMLQTRPNSASGILQNNQQNLYSTASPQMNRNSYHGINSGAQPSTYRGHSTAPTVAPYAFTSTPSLTGPHSRQHTAPSFLRHDHRTTSAPVTPTLPAMDRSRYPAAASISTSSSTSSSDVSAAARSAGTRDDSSISSVPSASWGATRANRPQSTVMTSLQGMPAAQPTTARATPERYRRTSSRRVDSNGGNGSSPTSSVPPSPSGKNTSSSSQFSSGSQTSYRAFQSPTAQFYSQSITARSSADDMRLNHQQQGKEEAARYRRRSIHTVDISAFSETTRASFQKSLGDDFTAGTKVEEQQQHPLRSYPVIPQAIARPTSSPGRSVSSDNRASNAERARFAQPSAVVPANPAQSQSAAAEQPSSKPNQQPAQSQSRLVDIPPRSSSTPDAAKRVINPSPLSKPMTMSPDLPATKDSFASAVNAAISTPTKQPTPPSTANSSRPDSPAARQLAALTGNDDKKTKTSRLRRAFSFGSAAELRKASNGSPVAAPSNNVNNLADERARLRKGKYQDEREAEQAKIAERQEAGGIGAGIYSGQGNFFSGSTDNLSISSTASSASIMLRKMGKGMKKSTRSLVGLFRPKSVIGVPAADAPLPEFSQAQVSMVTVEAERERVNVNADPHDQAKGGTGFPKLERNSIDAASSTGHTRDSGSISETARKSIAGGEKERAEVLAAVKKGILKRAGTESPTSSPMIRPVDSKTPNFNLPTIPASNDSPISSAPSTPNEDSQGHKRTGSVALNGEDYFMSALRFRGDSKSTPGTPQAHATLKRNATFSPRIQFHDTWPSGEYDRRGEIATCNRLTPMLAQQIKEELNNFKMEMEVHENSKIYTHFF